MAVCLPGAIDDRNGAADVEINWNIAKHPHAVKVPARSTIHAILDRHGLVSRARRSRTRAEGTPLSSGQCDGCGPMCQTSLPES